MKSVLQLFAFLARHFFCVMLAMVVGCVLWTVVYGALFAAAVITGQGLGGPLAFPAGIFSVVGACVFVGWGVFAPAAAAGAVFCVVFRFPRLAAIPVVFLAGFVFSYLIYWAFIVTLTTHPMPSALVVLKNFSIYLSIPLGAYWWLIEGPGALFEVFCRWLRPRHQGSEPATAERL
ncbi:MAG: hypothetical protein ACKO2G_12945 [Verrucomicrobiales bacterium]